MIRCRSEVEEAVRMISSTYSSKADNVDIWWARNKYPCVIVNKSFIFVTHSLFPVRISKDMERRLRDKGGGGGGGGGDGGVVGGVGVICGDGVDRGVGSVDCGVVKAPVSTMIVSVPEKDRWCGARGKFVWWKGVRVTKASERANVGVRVSRVKAEAATCKGTCAVTTKKGLT
ncbi:hypothetical protein Tco_1152443, partial [Tanacetum coccineum]